MIPRDAVLKILAERGLLQADSERADLEETLRATADGTDFLDRLVRRGTLTRDQAEEVARAALAGWERTQKRPARNCSSCGEPVPDADPSGKCPRCGELLLNAAAIARLGVGRADEGPPGPVPEFDPSESAIHEMPEEAAEALKNTDNRLGRYVRIRQLGIGGMGVVWLSWDLKLRRLVALKLLSGPGGTPADANDTSGDEIKRFYREAQTAAKLRHPNIVPIYEVGTEKDAAGRTLYYIAMEYVDGATLEKANLPVRRILEVVRDVAQAVQAAHEQGIIHRDLKPANVMLDTAGRPYVMDFGLAKFAGTTSSLSATGTVVGTPSFMAPEQAMGIPSLVTSKSDVYSLGALLYALTAGRPPYTGTTPMEILRAVVHEDPPKPRRMNPKLHADIETITMRAMERDPMRRYFSAKELALDISRYLEGEPILARPSGFITRGFKKLKRHRAQAALVVAALAILAASGALWFALRPRAPDPGEPWVTVFEDDFNRMELGPRWSLLRGQEKGSGLHEGAYCSRYGILVFLPELRGDVEFEFDARVMPDSPDCKEISVFLHGSKDGALSDGYTLEFGIGDNTYNCVQRLRTVAIEKRDILIEKGRTYRMKASRVGDTLTYAADGKPVISYRDPLPLPSAGHIGFASQCLHVHFDNVRVRQPLTAAGQFADRAFEAGDYSLADPAYENYVKYRGSEREILSRRALTMFRVGRATEAEASLRQEIDRGESPSALAQAAATLAAIFVEQRRFVDADELLGTTLNRVTQPEARDGLGKKMHESCLSIDRQLEDDAVIDFWKRRADRWRGVNDVGCMESLNFLSTAYSYQGDEEGWHRSLTEYLAVWPGRYDLSGPGHQYLAALMRWVSGDVEAARRTLREQSEREQCPGIENWPGHRASALSYLIVLEAAEGRPTAEGRGKLDKLIPVANLIDEAEVSLNERLILADLLEGKEEESARHLRSIVDHCRRGIDMQPQSRHAGDFYAGKLSVEEYLKLKLFLTDRCGRHLRIALKLLAEGDRERGRKYLGEFVNLRFPGSLKPAAAKLLQRIK